MSAIRPIFAINFNSLRKFPSNQSCFQFIEQTMKLIVICGILLVLAISSMAVPKGNGRPGCSTSEEIQTKFYRNFWDPTAYWECSQLNKPAAPVRCPDEEAFLDSAKKCVPWEEWSWDKPKAPPSVPIFLKKT